MTSEPNCTSCRFCLAEADTLYCRRYPPQFMPDGPVQIEGFGMNPMVEEEDWCGEYRAKGGVSSLMTANLRYLQT